MTRKEVLLLVASTLCFFILLDQIFRIAFPPYYKPQKYGWDIKENTTVKHTIEDSVGIYRKVSVQYFRNGFKRWGDVHTSKPKVLILGDSYTEMKYVNNGEEWYAYLQRAFKNTEFFVFGAGGYGSLQEYMILNDYIDQIHPQYIVIQFCGNDFSNNFYRKDLMDYPGNNFMVRPYLEDGRIVYRLPVPFSFLRKISFTFDHLMGRYDEWRKNDAWRNRDEYSKNKLLLRNNLSQREKQRLKEIDDEALNVTKKIYAMIKERAGDTPVILLNIDGTAHLQEICREDGITCVSKINDAIGVSKKEGRPIFVINNGHWNKLGNQIAGEALVKYFQDILK